jgi:hypothetical protein
MKRSFRATAADAGRSRRPGEAGPVEEDAGLVLEPGDPLPVLVLVDRPAGDVGLLPELPLVGTEDLRRGDDALAVGLVGEVRTVAAAALFELGSRTREDAGQPRPKMHVQGLVRNVTSNW